MPKGTSPIPRSELRMGVLTCLSVVASRLEETTVLLSAGLLTQSAVVFSFAVEEFGKAALLRAAYESRADPVVVREFYDHEAKLAAAANHISARYLLLQKPGFQPTALPRGFQAGKPADWSARLSGLYVDWDEGWQYGVTVDPVVLKRSIDGVQAALEKAMVDWT